MTASTDNRGREPARETGGPLAFVKNLRGEGFTVVDAETHERVGELGSGKHPHAVAVHPSGRWAYVPFMTSGTVEVVDLRVLAVTDSTDAVGEAPVGAAVTRGGRYLVVTSYGPLPGHDVPGLAVFETDTGNGSLSLVDHLPVGKAAGVVVDAANTVWVALKDENAVVRLDGTPPFAERDRFPVAADPQDVAYSRAYGLLGVNGVDAGRVTFVDTLDGELLVDVPAPNPRGGTAVPAHDRWFVSDTDGDGLTVVDLDAVRRGSGGESAVERITLGTPTAFTDVTPDGSHVVVDAYDDDRVTFVDAETLAVRARVRTGASPHHAQFTADGRACYVPNMDADTVTVLDTTALSDGGDEFPVLAEIAVPSGSAPSSCFFTNRRLRR